MSQFTIELKSLRFFATHGMYQEEMKVGNEFEVDVSIGYAAAGKKISSIEDTVNYVEVYQILQAVFTTRKLLLESLAIEIAEAVHERFNEIKSISISIRKMNPPITNFSGSVSVNYSREFK